MAVWDKSTNYDPEELALLTTSRLHCPRGGHLLLDRVGAPRRDAGHPGLAAGAEPHVVGLGPKMAPDCSKSPTNRPKKNAAALTAGRSGWSRSAW